MVREDAEVLTRCAVLGSPIAHSLSPVMHRAAYAELGLEWDYDAVEVTEEVLPGFLAGLDESWRGLSLTMPLKRVVIPLLDEADDAVALSGVANTVVLEGGRRRGANTDIAGAAAAVAERVPTVVRRAVVVGGGATATSVLLALADAGLDEATLLVRDPARAEETVAAVVRHPHSPQVHVRRIDEPDVVEADLVVSTVPASAQDEPLLERLGEVPAVFEVVYDPWPTPLAATAIIEGRALISGVDLLAHQAALQVQLMTGSEVAVELLRRAALDELEHRD